MKLALAIFLLAVSTALSQAPTPAPTPAPQGEKVTPKAPYDDTKLQLLRSQQENLDLKARMLTETYQSQMKPLQDRFNVIEVQLTAEEDAVRKANGWDKTYLHNRETGEWTHTITPPTPPASPASPAEKK